MPFIPSAALLQAAGETLPGGWYDVVVDGGLVDDETTDNTAALQALIDSIPAPVEYGAFATFVWPFTNKGIYGFGSQVNWGERAIRNIGSGMPNSWDVQRIIAVMPLANSMTLFRTAKAAGGGHAGPSFENMTFYGNNKTNCVGLDIYQMNGIVLRNVGFKTWKTGGIGMRLDEDGEDCAYHDFQNLHFFQCATGLHSVSSNSWTLTNFFVEECTLGFHLFANQTQIYGGKFNSLGTGSSTGIFLNGYTNLISGTSFEVLTGGGDGNVMIDIDNESSGSAIRGCWNAVKDIGLTGAGSTTSIGVRCTSGANDNEITTRWQNGWSGTNFFVNAGKRNRYNGGFVGLAADKPAASLYPGQTYFETDSVKLKESTGQTWRNVRSPAGDTYNTTILASTPKAWYKLQDASGNPQDASGNALHMTSVTGTPLYHQTGVGFSDGPYAITLGDAVKLNRSSVVSTVTDNFTMEFWFKWNILGVNNAPLVNNGDASHGWGVVIDYDNHKIQYVAQGVAYGASSATVFSQYEWYFVHVVCASGTWKYYVNGVVDTSNAGTDVPVTPSGTLVVGGTSVGFDIEHLAVYETALSAGDIAAHYATVEV